MDGKTIEYFKNKLLKEKENILETLEFENDNGVKDSLQEYFKELSVYDNHPADIGSETYEKEMRMNLRKSEERRLREVEDALRRIEKGNFGICKICGNSIETERLDILPTTNVCKNCKDKGISIEERIETRPVEEEVLKYPFGRTYNDNSEINAFDGEDAYQEVMRYNKTDYRKMALDWYDNNMYDENISGKVEEVDDISNDYYKKQMTDENKNSKMK